MRLIDADVLHAHFLEEATLMDDPIAKMITTAVAIDVLHSPTVDAIPVIRCKDCIHHHGHDCENMNYRWTSDDFYCGWAEREEDGQNNT